MMSEFPVVFQSKGQWLNGIIHTGAGDTHQGVLIVVGGPQTRVGSNRQFVLLARALMAAGYHVMRFDYQGMGDSEGSEANFLDAEQDIEAAINTFKSNCPLVNDVALWGLCDAASAILLHQFCRQSPQINLLILLNPWVRTEQLQAETRVKNYYWNKILSKSFWQRLFKLDVNVFTAIKELIQSLIVMRGAGKASIKRESGVVFLKENYVHYMQLGLKAFSGKVCFIFSGNDITADEFKQLIGKDSSWNQLVYRSEKIVLNEVPVANHTFASVEWRQRVIDITLEQLSHVRCKASASKDNCVF
ncbi:hydrolase 1, exosortase A system-associated [Psychrobium sp. 1_MG-2023]|uniref:hydrolase 1, exosortase A system-associated n=1 Tax=Psychrobium sp. 1_MG-2023 TaxID=3062624 RepID=UPI000C341553|nr:hydrolase 1, exosortase A system-associated [Psychrobium sp. 1_MG-2023]MDP2561299.1 hydrolase 1, exosortase A system-associated [Psychrobium sp. 1_MG-2023]PKF54115.1 hydrolase 1, exosortase A system-associated [Alteromonadales bacterium alter-6D02]